jgi:hypothetical protein
MSNLLDALWVEYLDHDSETDAESKLLAAVRVERSLTLAWANDHALDCSLRSLNHIAETEADFVADWELRVQESAYSAQELAEPPVAEQPGAQPLVTLAQVSSAQIFSSAPRLTAQYRASRYTAQTETTAALVATVALLALVAISLWIFRGNENFAQKEAPKSKVPPVVPAIPTKERNPAVDQPFRFVLPAPQTNPAQITPVVWQTGGPQNNRLPRGKHLLKSGLVELIGGKATPVTVTAPASVMVGDDDTWFVERGTVSVSDLPSGDRLPIVTPNSRINSQGAEFVVSVNDAGQTDLQVRRGEVYLLSGAVGENAAPLRLLAGEFEQAQLSPPSKEPGNGPAFCQLRGPENRFCGLIQLDGKTLRFAALAEFQDFQKQVEEQFAKDAEELRHKWPDLVRALGGTGGGEIQLERDGEPQEIQTLEQLLEFLKQLPVPPGVELKPSELKPGAMLRIPRVDLPKPGEANSSFHGTIIINGQEQKFNSAEEFNAARKKLLDQLGPLGPSGLPDLDKLDIPLP